MAQRVCQLVLPSNMFSLFFERPNWKPRLEQKGADGQSVADLQAELDSNAQAIEVF